MRGQKKSYDNANALFFVQLSVFDGELASSCQRIAIEMHSFNDNSPVASGSTAVNFTEGGPGVAVVDDFSLSDGDVYSAEDRALRSVTVQLMSQNETVG